MADAPDDYIASKCKGIVGIEIPISRLEGKWKMNQAKSEHDVLGVINGLRAQGDGNLADLVASANEQKQQG
jgi:transcriptional regulator